MHALLSKCWGRWSLGAGITICLSLVLIGVEMGQDPGPIERDPCPNSPMCRAFEEQPQCASFNCRLVVDVGAWYFTYADGHGGFRNVCTYTNNDEATCGARWELCRNIFTCYDVFCEDCEDEFYRDELLVARLDCLACP